MAHAQRATVLKGEYTSGQMLTIIGHFAFAVGMRLHFLIFAAIQRVPFVALPYASKVTGFLDALEMPMPPLQQVNAGRLIAHIDRSWDLHADLQARIDRALPPLQERARETNKIAVRLLLESNFHPGGGVSPQSVYRRETIDATIPSSTPPPCLTLPARTAAIIAEPDVSRGRWRTSGAEVQPSAPRASALRWCWPNAMVFLAAMRRPPW